MELIKYKMNNSRAGERKETNVSLTFSPTIFAPRGGSRFSNKDGLTKVLVENKYGKAKDGEPNEEVENCEQMKGVEDKITKVDVENKTGKTKDCEPNEEVENCEQMKGVEDKITKVDVENKTRKAKDCEPNEEVENCEQLKGVEDGEDFLEQNETNDVEANETDEEDGDVCLERNETEDVEANETAEEDGEDFFEQNETNDVEANETDEEDGYVCLERNEIEDVETNETAEEMGAAQMMQILLLFFTAVAFLTGYILGSLKTMMVVYTYGVVVTATITIPCCSFLNHHPFNWLDQSEAKKHPKPQEQGLVRQEEIENEETDECVLQEMMEEELKLMLVHKLEVINESFQTLEEKLEIRQKDEGQIEEGNEKIEEAAPLVVKIVHYIKILEKKIKRLVTFMEIEAEKSMEEWKKRDEEKRDFLAKLAAETALSQTYRDLLHNFGCDGPGINNV